MNQALHVINLIDWAVKMDGDGQIDPDDLPTLLKPVVEGRADYSKGNRLFSKAYQKIFKIRYLGNAFLSLLTKIVFGCWHVADFHSGFTERFIGKRFYISPVTTSINGMASQTIF